MAYKRVLGFILLLTAFLYAGQHAARAYSVIFRNGQILGAAGTVEYTYVVRAIPSPTGPPPQAATATPIPPSPTPTTASGFTGLLQALGLSLDSAPPPELNTLNANNHNGQGGGSNPPTTAPTIPPTQAPTAPPLCGGVVCQTGKVCYQNYCRDACDASGRCIGAYRCEGGACVPDGNVRTPQAPVPAADTATPIPQNTNKTPPPAPPYSPDSVNAPPPPVNTPVPPTPIPTNTPYPTFAPKNRTFYDNTKGSDKPIVSQIPYVPPALKGDKSTIIVELPVAQPDPAHPNAPTPIPSLMVYKGEDMKAIKINLAKPAQAAEHEDVPQEQTPQPPQQNLDITIEAKKGQGIAIAQQQFVIQRGVQQATITANDRQQGTLVLEKNDTKARITMPMTIDPTTNILTIDTPMGPMKVSIMPDDAVAISRQLKVIDKNLEPQDIAIEIREGSLQYHIKADKQEKLLFVIPISVPREVYIAADTGSLSEIKQSSLWNFVSLFTF